MTCLRVEIRNMFWNCDRVMAMASSLNQCRNFDLCSCGTGADGLLVVPVASCLAVNFGRLA